MLDARKLAENAKKNAQSALASQNSMKADAAKVVVGVANKQNSTEMNIVSNPNAPAVPSKIGSNGIGRLADALHSTNKKFENVFGETIHRLLIGDAVSFAFDITTPGGSFTLERVIILRGNNAGQTGLFLKAPPSKEGEYEGSNIHLDAGAGYQVTKYLYSGDINELNVNMFQGLSFSLDAGKYNLDVGYSTANVDGGTIRGFMSGFSKGTPIGFGGGFEWTRYLSK